MKRFHVFFVLMMVVVSFFGVLCSDSDSKNDNDENGSGPNESVAQEITKEYKGADLEFQFDAGVKMLLKSSENEGAVQGDITIKFLKEETYFNGPNDLAFDFSDINSSYHFNLEYTLKPDLAKEDISVVQYAPELSTEELTAKAVNFEYDQSTGAITGSFSVSGNDGGMKKTAGGRYSRLLISYSDRMKLGEGAEECILRVPYYEQPGNTCWAACAAMMARSYSEPRNSFYSNTIIDFVKYMEHSDLNEGIGIWDFKFNLPRAVKRFSETTAEVSTFVSKSNMLEEIMKKLREKKPMIMNLTYPGIGRHAIMVIGYKRELVSLAKIDVKLLIHNPQNVGEESMNQWVDFDWLMKEKSLTEAYQILYPKTALSDPALVTLGLPVNQSFGKLAFVVESGAKKYSIGLIYDESQEDAYSWAFPNETICEILPDTTSYIDLKLPVYHCGETSLNTKLSAKIIDKETGKAIEDLSDTRTFGPGENYIEAQIGLNNVTSEETFEGEVAFEVKDAGSDRYLDGYRLKFKMEPSRKITLVGGFLVTCKYNDGNESQGGASFPETVLKGDGKKFMGQINNEMSVSSIRTVTKGTLSLEFDKPVNPTKIVSLQYDVVIEAYYDGEKRSDSNVSCEIAGLPLGQSSVVIVDGDEVCQYINSFSSKTVSVDPDYEDIVLQSYKCSSASKLTLTIK